jgi:hypothetical protein
MDAGLLRSKDLRLIQGELTKEQEKLRYGQAQTRSNLDRKLTAYAFDPTTDAGPVAARPSNFYAWV